MQTLRPIKHRNLVFVAIMSLITFGIYFIYWVYSTKEEMNSLGGRIPSLILFFIPLVHIYFFYEYSKYFVTKVQKLPGDSINIIVFTAVMSFFPILGMMFIQNDLNALAETNVDTNRF